MDDKFYNPEEIKEALKIAAALDEPEEFHIPVKELEGLSLEAVLNAYPQVQVNSFNNEFQLEVLTEMGTIFCDFKNNVCMRANLFLHEDDINREVAKDYVLNAPNITATKDRFGQTIL